MSPWQRLRLDLLQFCDEARFLVDAVQPLIAVQFQFALLVLLCQLKNPQEALYPLLRI